MRDGGGKMAVEGIDIDMQSVASLATNVEKIAATIDDELVR